LASNYLEEIHLTTLRLFIKADLQEQSLHDWMVLDQTGQVIRHGTSDLNELPSCHETEVVIPTHLVNFIDIQLPEVPSKKLETTLPFIVEEFVLSSPEDVHVVIASRIGDQATLAVIQKAWIKNCVSALSRAKLQAKRMFPDCLLLAHKENAWTIAQQGKSILVRTSQTKGFAFDLTDSDHNVVPYLLLAAFKEKDQFSTPKVFQAYGECAETITGWAIKLGIQGGVAINREWKSNRISVPFNLLQKEFSPSNDFVQRLYQFKSCALIAGIILALQCCFTLIDLGLQYRQSHRLDQEMISVFKASFPETTTIVDAPLQMQRKLEEIKHAGGESGSSDFEPLLAVISQTIGAIPPEKLISMAYQDRKITLTFRIETIDQAEAMLQKLASAGLSATLERGQVNGPLTEVKLIISAGLK
jgi:type II secretion system protein L